MKYRISVIIPTFNPIDYLWMCLDSLYSQTLSKDEFEIIIVLNGCNEPYRSRINSYIAAHKELHFNLIQTDDSGVSNARNIGLDNAKGEYIAFIDDDDYVSPKYLEELLQKSNDKTIALSYELAFNDGTKNYYPYYITNEYNRLHGLGVVPFYKARRLFNGPVYKLIHKDVIRERKFNVNFKNSEDALFMILISDNFVNAIFTSRDAIYYRRVRNNSASTMGRRSFSYRLKNGIKLIIESYRIYFSNTSNYKFRFISRQVIGFVRDIFFI